MNETNVPELLYYTLPVVSYTSGGYTLGLKNAPHSNSSFIENYHARLVLPTAKLYLDLTP